MNEERLARGESAPAQVLHVYATFVALSVLGLICSGGLVTSKGAGLSVPDWPTSYGYNMFAFPLSRWVGGVLYEHAHRLIASGVGILTVILAAALWRFDRRRWMRRLGFVAVAAVVLQGVLGGLRVVMLKDQIGIFHACLAQAFLLLTAFIALATSRWWFAAAGGRQDMVSLAKVFAAISAMIFCQLGLGATMRHAHAGLAIRDFPLAYGRVWPPLNGAALQRINRERTEDLALPPTTAPQIVLQMLHRLGAGLIGLAVISAAWMTRREHVASVLGWTGVGLIALQITAGIYTIWTNKAADVATAHVALGALSFVWAGLTTAVLLRLGRSAGSAVVAPDARLVEAGV